MAENSASLSSADKRGQHTSQLSHRYRDSYRVATWVVGFGRFCKFLGLLLGGLALIAGISMMGAPSAGLGVQWEAVTGLFIIAAGLVSAIFFFILGVLVSSIGQMQRAMLDIAINSSPLINDDDRAEIMGIG